jgi:hypothetical protein
LRRSCSLAGPQRPINVRRRPQGAALAPAPVLRPSRSRLRSNTVVVPHAGNVYRVGKSAPSCQPTPPRARLFHAVHIFRRQTAALRQPPAVAYYSWPNRCPAAGRLVQRYSLVEGVHAHYRHSAPAFSTKRVVLMLLMLVEPPAKERNPSDELKSQMAMEDLAR